VGTPPRALLFLSFLGGSVLAGLRAFTIDLLQENRQLSNSTGFLSRILNFGQSFFGEFPLLRATFWVVALPWLALLAGDVIAQEGQGLSWQPPQSSINPGAADHFADRSAAQGGTAKNQSPSKQSSGMPAAKESRQTPPRVAMPPKMLALPPANPNTVRENSGGVPPRVPAEIEAEDALSGSFANQPIAQTARRDTNIALAQGTAPAAATSVSPPAKAAAAPMAPAPAYAPPIDAYALSAGARPAGFFEPPLFDRPLLGGGLMNSGPMFNSGELVWLRGEYLGWYSDGMRTPVLVTSSLPGTPQNNAAVLGLPNTRTLFGGTKINDDYQQGFRASGGFWFNRAHALGLEADYFQLFEQTTNYTAASNGTAIIGRPFFDMNNGRETAELVSFPGLVSGSVAADAAMRFNSFGIRGRGSLCGPGDPCQPVLVNGIGNDRTDWLIGYRYANLQDDLAISERLTSLLPAAPGGAAVRDSFETGNQFHGLELGIVNETTFYRMWLETTGKIAVGNNRQTVTIGGTTDLTEAGITDRFNGGILAQRTNIGSYSRDELAVLPQLGATLGLHVTPRLSVTVGYSFVYFSNVVRAGDQIDTDVNPNLFPEEANPFSGPLRPRFTFRETDFWTHGITFGGDLRF
jgi:hypothetical protein